MKLRHVEFNPYTSRYDVNRTSAEGRSYMAPEAEIELGSGERIIGVTVEFRDPYARGQETHVVWIVQE